MTTSAYLRWKDLDNRLEAARRAHNIPEMQSILGLMTETVALGAAIVILFLGLAVIAKVVVRPLVARVVIRLGIEMAIAAPMPGVATRLAPTILSHSRFSSENGIPKG